MGLLFKRFKFAALLTLRSLIHEIIETLFIYQFLILCCSPKLRKITTNDRLYKACSAVHRYLKLPRLKNYHPLLTFPISINHGDNFTHRIFVYQGLEAFRKETEGRRIQDDCRPRQTWGDDRTNS